MRNYKKIWINTLILVLLIFLTIAIYSNQGEITKRITIAGIKTIYILIALLMARSLITILTRSIALHYEKEGSMEKSFIIESLTKSAIWLIVGLVVISIIFGSWTNILTALGLLGAGLAVAMQQPILNLVGWTTLLLGRFYVIGDRIEIDGIKGDVYDITPMYTKLRRLDNNDEPTGSSITIPNQYILSKPIVNYSKPTKYIWDEIKISITYESNIKKAREIMLEALRETMNYEEEASKAIKRKRIKFIDMGIEPKIRMIPMDSSIDLKLRYLVQLRRKNEIRSMIMNKIIEKIRKTRSVDFAYPHVQIVK
ncbi:mechanosensitive ion channel [Candidatus Woesearchaeota archaeon]|nr:mechanosensitive ion channel [Candidatus Woesearchaeota archaeon]